MTLYTELTKLISENNKSSTTEALFSLNVLTQHCLDVNKDVHVYVGYIDSTRMHSIEFEDYENIIKRNRHSRYQTRYVIFQS